MASATAEGWYRHLRRLGAEGVERWEPAMPFTCTARQTAGRVVLTVAGDVDLAAHARFEADVETSWTASEDLVIDCSQVTFLDSMGLRVLVRTWHRAAESGREFALAAPSECVVRVLELAGVTGLFPVVGSIPDAETDADPDPDPAA